MPVTFEHVDAAVAGTKFMTSRQGRTIHDFLVEHNLGRILELGFAHGKSTCYLGAAADALDGSVLTMDTVSARERKPNIHELLERCGLSHRVTPVFSETSFTWDLMKLLERDPQPRFDFAYMDGGHTWDVTGFGFLLVDRLLAPGGWIVFDDMNWTFAKSTSLSGTAKTKRMPEDVRTTPQVRKVFELLVATQPGYVDLHEKDGWGWARKARPA
jgi:predicted O-methyltransferase YrrM